MAKKLPWRKWFPTAWTSEQAIAKASLAGRGLWCEALNVMMSNDTYKLEGSRNELALILRCNVSELNAALPSLQASRVGDVTLHSNGSVTLVCRRLKRECIARENGRKRQSAFREKQGCNAPKASISTSTSESLPEKEGGLGEENDASGVPTEAGGVGVFHQLRAEIWAFFKRPDGQRAGYEEEHLLSEISRSPSALDEWNTIRASKHGFKRQSVLTLLQNWAGELDKARNFTPPPALDRNGRPIPKPKDTLVPEGLPSWMAREIEKEDL